ncbi:Amidophosphoribosyltransferase [Vibrio aerogenes CECT 7868]|uniref:Amidophosphoribosyltransferase n=1 Tax=Vibrio aerogenes CECT 7868 TaxID=1216006 RepID=A0A1M5YUM3_9VIBR|nr:phosphoribosyltransferase family protein [Vibrio aerogenes]SHI15787.1 Amidophosphoribosyltransferase [Vibrio aerogenes CECT 7868]
MRYQRFKNTICKMIPRQCPLCELELYAAEGHWCTHCMRWFESSPRCQRCGEPTLEPVSICGQCLSHPPLWNKLYCLGDYSFPLNIYISKIKYQRQFWHVFPLCQLLARQITEPAEQLISVPMHWQRYLIRGFNQSDLIASRLSRLLNTSYSSGIVKKNHATRPQQKLSRQARLRNLNSAFELKCHTDKAHVAIVDDVVTTGTTVSQLCHLLQQSGVRKIDIYCLCKTPENHLSN